MAQAAKKLNMPFSSFKRIAVEFGCYYPNQGGCGMVKEYRHKIPLNDILAGKHPDYYTSLLKQRLLKEGYKKAKCEEPKCEISDWLGDPVAFELHHIDGDNTNHRAENLELLCPNCHGQRHVHINYSNVKKATDEEIIDKVNELGTINKALKELNIAVNGYNYRRVQNLMAGWGN